MKVKSELEKHGLHCITIELGEVEIRESITVEQENLLNIDLEKSGLSLLGDKKSVLVEKIKNIIVELIHYSDKRLEINFSDYLSEKLDYNYTYLANLFSEDSLSLIKLNG